MLPPRPMHPVIAHFLDPKNVRGALEKSAKGEALTEIERLFVNAATAHPDRKERALTLDANSGMEDQQAALALAVFAALVQVEQNPVLSPIIQTARRALADAGATDDETQQFLSLVLLEEAFAFDDEASDFDQDLVAETFRTLPKLAQLDEAKVEALEEAFLKGVPGDKRPLPLATVEALFGAAWSDGPVPVSPEHVEAALEALRAQTSDADFGAAVKALQGLLQLLAREGLVGLQRLKRLLDHAGLVATALSQPEAEGDGLEDDGEETGDETAELQNGHSGEFPVGDDEDDDGDEGPDDPDKTDPGGTPLA